MFSGYFRDSQLERAGPGAQSRGAVSRTSSSATTFGGPIIKDRLHYFGNYEYEREPRTTFSNTPWPAFNVALSGVEGR